MARTHPLPPPPLASPSPPQPGHGFIPEDASSPRKHTGLAIISAISTLILSMGSGVLAGAVYWLSECLFEPSCPAGAGSAWIIGGIAGAAGGTVVIVLIHTSRHRLKNLWGLMVVPPGILALIILFSISRFF